MSARPHTTHFDDCGCKSERLLAELFAADDTNALLVNILRNWNPEKWARLAAAIIDRLPEELRPLPHPASGYPMPAGSIRQPPKGYRRIFAGLSSPGDLQYCHGHGWEPCVDFGVSVGGFNALATPDTDERPLPPGWESMDEAERAEWQDGTNAG